MIVSNILVYLPPKNIFTYVLGCSIIKNSKCFSNVPCLLWRARINKHVCDEIADELYEFAEVGVTNGSGGIQRKHNVGADLWCN